MKNKRKKIKHKQPLNAYPTLDSSTNTGFALDAIPNLVVNQPVTFIDTSEYEYVQGGSHSIDLSKCTGFE